MNNNQRINQLLMQTRGLSSTNLEGTALIERLRKEAFALSAWACREIDRITDERDEARRMYCDHVILHGTAHLINGNEELDEITDAQSLARHLGWDCFND